jgi:hypothetical protein
MLGSFAEPVKTSMQGSLTAAARVPSAAKTRKKTNRRMD